MILVFDLDHTLYDEWQFVRGGLRAVAAYLSEELGVGEQVLFRKMWETLESKGRGAVFDDILRSHRKYSKTRVQKCLSIYRSHAPSLRLFPDAKRCLTRFRKTPMYIVTDGNKLVQASKVRALGLERVVRKAYITHRHGLNHAKPSPECFRKIARLEKTSLEDLVYIGDDPNKDFVNLKPLGIRTFRILRGPHKDKKVSKTFDADYSISSLDELGPYLLK